MTEWTSEECERRFVEGQRITISALSEESGVKARRLRYLSMIGDWTNKRNTFQSSVKIAAQEKKIDAISDRLAQLEIEHVSDYAILRGVAMAKAKSLQIKIKGASSIAGIDLDSLGELASKEQQVKGDALKDADVVNLQALTNVVDKCIRGERMVLGAEYEDLNKAVAAITRAGLEVKAPTDAVLTKHVNS